MKNGTEKSSQQRGNLNFHAERDKIINPFLSLFFGVLYVLGIY